MDISAASRLFIRTQNRASAGISLSSSSSPDAGVLTISGLDSAAAGVVAIIAAVDAATFSPMAIRNEGH